jgi:hypothetical protein
LTLANFSLAFSALNRQMFVILFVVYAISLLKRKTILRIVLEILPSAVIVISGFYLFYVKYCDFLNSDVCWPVRQSRDLVFPVLVNLPVVSSLISIFLFPIIATKKLIEAKSLKLISVSAATLIVFMYLYGSEKIDSEKRITGGGLYKFRDLFGSFTLLFDVISISSLSIIAFFIFRLHKADSWTFHSILVIVASSIFGPYAFQRYFETYILILCSIFLAMNAEKIFIKSKFTLKHWALFLIFFQASELLASVFIPV